MVCLRADIFQGGSQAERFSEMLDAWQAEKAKLDAGKNLDAHHRWRSVTVVFRVSPEENQQLERLVQLTGLTKQDYIINRLLGREIVVQGNLRVYQALRDQLAVVLQELKRIQTGEIISDDLNDTIQFIAQIMERMKQAE